MQSTTKRCRETIGVATPGLVDNWQSIAPHGIDRYWRAMQLANCPLQSI